MNAIRPCAPEDRADVLEIINGAAEAYRGVIPADRWHEPYMPGEEFDAEVAAGVEFWGYHDGASLVGVMGLQRLADIDLIRHAYVRPGAQRGGVGGRLLEHIRGLSDQRILVGTWAAATWAIDFYRRHGFEPVAPTQIAPLLRAYWDIPDRQVRTSVVLASPPLAGE
jgi:GNAT superfamily N-acetyltransferase